MTIFPDPYSFPALKEHFVQFYESDISLLNVLSAFISAGLRTHESCLLFATRAHHEGLQERLRQNGIDIVTARTQGSYIWVDAADILPQVMLDGMPDREQFTRVVGDLAAQVTRGQRHARIFGELAALLWVQGRVDAAIRLEEFWNELHLRLPPFSLLCAYPIESFDAQTSS